MYYYHAAAYGDSERGIFTDIKAIHSFGGDIWTICWRDQINSGKIIRLQIRRCGNIAAKN